MSNFGQLRSAVHSKDIPAICLALSESKRSDWLNHMTYVHGNLGFVPASHWFNCSNPNCIGCRNYDHNYNPCTPFTDWNAPLRCELVLGGKKVRMLTADMGVVEAYMIEIKRKLFELEEQNFDQSFAELLDEASRSAFTHYAARGAVDALTNVVMKQPSKTYAAMRGIVASDAFWVPAYAQSHGDLGTFDEMANHLAMLLLKDLTPEEVIDEALR